jgi:hypothetical protein
MATKPIDTPAPVEYRDYPDRKVIRYNTGCKRLDNVLSAIAYGATLLFAIAGALALTAVVWGVGK